MEKRTKLAIALVVKAAISLGLIVWIGRKIVQHNEAGNLVQRLSDLNYAWVGFSFGVLVIAIICSVLRWHLLLTGQGIHAPFTHLLGSFFIGRFVGSFTPGGWTGLNGYRIYDIAKHTGQTAKSVATISIDMILGHMGFSASLILGSIYGVRYLGLSGVLLVDAAFLATLVVGVALLVRPGIFRKVNQLLPDAIQARLSGLIEAVCAYQGKLGLVSKTALASMGTHFFNTLIYVGAARALGVKLGVGEVFFVSAMQIFATLLPASVNGIGLRETAAVWMYQRVGVPVSEAALIPMLGFAVEMTISALGGFVLILRGTNYSPDIRVDDDDDAGRPSAVPVAVEPAGARREPDLAASAPVVPAASIMRTAVAGFGGGLLGGAVAGLVEALLVARSTRGAVDPAIYGYGVLIYGLVCGVAFGALAAFVALTRRRSGRPSTAVADTLARACAITLGLAVITVGSFRVRRDVFAESFAWPSAKGALVLVGMLLASVVVYFIVSAALRALLSAAAGRWLGRSWVLPTLVLACGALLTARARTGHGADDQATATRDIAPGAYAEQGNILLIVVDTLRADALPAWGYSAGKTPNLDAFARDSVRFEHAFATSTWTRPSFATLLTGMYASRHHTMGKGDVLADEHETIAESLQRGGYQTAGVVTNVNVSPYFGFQQGFGSYRYLEGQFVRGATDSVAKLLLVQAIKRVVERYKAATGRVEPGSAYQDAVAVNTATFRVLDSFASKKSPFFLFVGYMDPHDPYYEHPYNGRAVSRAAHPNPDPSEATELRRLYDGEITFWDEHFGKLMDELKKRGIYDSLTIVVTSDHGEEFFEHGGFWHGTTLYEEQVHVPLFLKLPRGEKAGSVVNHWVELVDVAPTLLRIAGTSTPFAVQGKDLFVPSREVYAEEDHEGNALESIRVEREGVTYKLITANAGNPRGNPPESLFQLQSDPKEKANLAAQQPGVLGDVRESLQKKGDAVFSSSDAQSPAFDAPRVAHR